MTILMAEIVTILLSREESFHGLTQVKSKAPSPAYTMCRIRLRMKIQRRPKMISTIKQTNSTPEHEVKSYLVCRSETNGHQHHIRHILIHQIYNWHNQLTQTCKEKRTTVKHTMAVMPTAITTVSVSWKLAIIPTM